MNRDNREDPRVIHVRYAGESHAFYLNELDIGHGSSDSRIREAIADRLGIGSGKLQNFQVERLANGNMTAHPEAVFGCAPSVSGFYA